MNNFTPITQNFQLDFEMKDKTLLLSNLEETELLENHQFTLRPYESRIYFYF